MPRINKIYGPTTIIKIVLDNPPSNFLEEYDPEVSLDGVLTCLDDIGISYALLNAETIHIPEANEEYFSSVLKRFEDYKKRDPRLQYVSIKQSN